MILVTGGYGFIGSYVCEELNKRGIAFAVLDSVTYAAVNRSFVRDMENMKFAYEESLTSFDWIEMAKGGPDVQAVIHCAAETHVDRSIAEKGSIDFLRTNVIGTSMVASFCAANDIHMVHFSTDEVYGDATEYSEVSKARIVDMLRNDEDGWDEKLIAANVHQRLRASSPYAASKVSAEYVIEAIDRTYGLRSSVLRPSNAYGKRQTVDKLIGVCIQRLADGKPMPLYDGGYQVRQWVHARDIARAAIAIVERRAYGVYNIGGSCLYRNVDLVEKIWNRCKHRGIEVSDTPWVSTPDRPGHDIAYCVDDEGCLRDFGWVPLDTIDANIDFLIDSYIA